MNDNVLDLPVRRKPGRRRVNSIPGHPAAQILQLQHPRSTLEEQIAEYDEAITTVVRGLLMAVKAIQEISTKYRDGSMFR